MAQPTVTITATDPTSPALAGIRNALETIQAEVAKIPPLSPLARSMHVLSIEAFYDPANGQLTMPELRERIKDAWVRQNAAEIAGHEDEAYQATVDELVRWLSATAVPISNR